MAARPRADPQPLTQSRAQEFANPSAAISASAPRGVRASGPPRAKHRQPRLQARAGRCGSAAIHSLTHLTACSGTLPPATVAVTAALTASRRASAPAKVSSSTKGLPCMDWPRPDWPRPDWPRPDWPRVD